MSSITQSNGTHTKNFKTITTYNINFVLKNFYIVRYEQLLEKFGKFCNK